MSSLRLALKLASINPERSVSGRVRLSKSLWRRALGVSSKECIRDLPMPGESGDMVRIVLAGGCVAFGVVARSDRWGSAHAIIRKDQLRIPRLICKGTPN
jgi:hypothetical protein